MYGGALDVTRESTREEGLSLHDYQEKAIDFALENETTHMMIDLGLGKTIIALKAIQAVGIPALVIAPLLPCYTTWPDEIRKWDVGLSHTILHGKTKDTNLFLNADIYILNYHGLPWFISKVRSGIKKWKKMFLVLDESSYLKDPKTRRFKILRTMVPMFSDYRMCLSATPSPNGLHELWPQYCMLDDGQRLGKSHDRFMKSYFVSTGPPRYLIQPHPGTEKALKYRVSDITYRLEAKDHIKMPPIVYNKIKLDLPQKLRKQYKKLESDFFLQFEESVASAKSAVALSMKLRQFVQGAVYLDRFGKGPKEYEVIHTVKVDALKSIADTVRQPILCPLHFRFEVEMIRKKLGRRTPVIHGGTNKDVAYSLIRRWNLGEIPLLLCHPQSIGHGVNLQSGGHIILWFGLTFSLEQYQQLNGRLHRQGQKHGVVVSHLVFDKTIDDHVFDVITRKDMTQSKFLESMKKGAVRTAP